MDWVALASVVVSGVLGASGVGASVWTTRRTLRSARQGQVDARRLDAYLELLKLVGHQTLAIDYRIESAELAGDLSVVYGHAPVRRPTRQPAPEEMATVSALAAAYASDDVKEACQAWLDAVREIDRRFDRATWNYDQNYVGVETETDPEDLAALREQHAVVGASAAVVERTVRGELQDLPK